MLASTERLIREANMEQREVDLWLKTGRLPERKKPVCKAVSIAKDGTVTHGGDTSLSDRELMRKGLAVAREQRIAPQVFSVAEHFVNRGRPLPDHIRKVLTDATSHATRTWVGDESSQDILDHAIAQVRSGSISPQEVSEIRQLLTLNRPIPSYILEKLNRR